MKDQELAQDELGENDLGGVAGGMDVSIRVNTTSAIIKGTTTTTTPKPDTSTPTGETPFTPTPTPR